MGGRVSRIAAGEEQAARRPLSMILNPLPDWEAVRKLRKQVHPVDVLRENLREETARLSDQVFERVTSDPERFHELP